MAERGGAKWEGTDVRTVVAPHHDCKMQNSVTHTTLTEVATTKKRISYLDAVDFLARHNDVIGLDKGHYSEAFASVGLIALVFGVNVSQVARDVVRMRRKVENAEERRFIARLTGRAKKPPASGRMDRRSARRAPRASSRSFTAT